MIPFPLLDILADDWLRSRRESARTYGTRPSRLPEFAAIRRLFSSKPVAEAPAPVVAPRNRTA
jgi:hypothetical protein